MTKDTKIVSHNKIILISTTVGTTKEAPATETTVETTTQSTSAETTTTASSTESSSTESSTTVKALQQQCF